MIPRRDPLAQMQVDPIEDVIDAARRGEPIVLVDSEDRENEGDVVVVAEFATPEVIAFMARRASGLICLAVTETRASELGLRRSSDLSCLRQTAFTQSIEAKEGITTGISAADRAHTIATAIDPGQGPEAICSPGHMSRAATSRMSVRVLRILSVPPYRVAHCPGNRRHDRLVGPRLAQWKADLLDWPGCGRDLSAGGHHLVSAGSAVLCRRQLAGEDTRSIAAVPDPAADHYRGHLSHHALVHGLGARMVVSVPPGQIGRAHV